MPRPIPQTRQILISRTLAAAAILALALSAPPASAQTDLKDSGKAAQTAEEAAEARATSLDRLFEALQSAPSEVAARRLTDQIWGLWFVPPDADAGALMAEATAMMQRGDLEGAHGVLDQLVTEAPDWAEGWNQRAYVRFLQGRYDASLDDIDETLTREPRHFGALSGRAMCFFRQGRIALGRAAIEETLAIHPWSPERRMLEALPTPPAGQDI